MQKLMNRAHDPLTLAAGALQLENRSTIECRARVVTFHDGEA